jgi:hypothetical protein
MPAPDEGTTTIEYICDDATLLSSPLDNTQPTAECMKAYVEGQQYWVTDGIQGTYQSSEPMATHPWINIGIGVEGGLLMMTTGEVQ